MQEQTPKDISSHCSPRQNSHWDMEFWRFRTIPFTGHRARQSSWTSAEKLVRDNPKGLETLRKFLEKKNNKENNQKTTPPYKLFLTSFSSTDQSSYWLTNLSTFLARPHICSSLLYHWPLHFRHQIYPQQTQDLLFGWVTSSRRVPDPKISRDGESTISPGDVLQWLTTCPGKSY